MEISFRALVTLIHGMLFGAFFVMAAYALVVELIREFYAGPSAPLTTRGEALRRIYLASVVAAGWVALLMGSYIIYPWYRATPPAGVANLGLYSRSLLKSNPATAGWHDFGMEWKEHVAWIALIAMSMVAHVLTQYQRSWRKHRQVRTAVLVFAFAALAASAVAGFFGAMLNKYAPVNGGPNIHWQGKTNE